MINFCPRCGAELPADISVELSRTSLRCPDCRLAPTEVPSMLAPSQEEGTELGYELDDWPVTDRGFVTSAFLAAGIPYRWDPGLVLVVPTELEAKVDQLMDELQAEEVDPAADAESTDADDGDGEEDWDEAEEDADGGEAAAEAMSDLFVAADRLKDAPFDTGAGDDLAAAAAVAAECLPPYGIEKQVWTQVQEQAAGIAGSLEEDADDEIVAAAARTLRDFLRSYI